ncbi:hypothetical protein WJX72_006347 [[Myrmecia] bisecta]|uniref:RRM domain-containing protein n=1 Tax=[Myrmecia] bisecta TaxID=41462 RepID=A0AAW1QR33_9CHLO
MEPSISGAEEKSSRVVYIGHLPHGFYEDQLLGFFEQFGKLTRVRVSRNKKTGKAKHYAFLEFYSPEVANIAAEAMDGYIMFTQKLQCRVMRESEVHANLFKGANRKFKAIPWQKIEAERHNKERTIEEEAQRTARAIKRDQQRQKRIRDAGLDYEYTPLQTLVAPKAKHTKFNAD